MRYAFIGFMVMVGAGVALGLAGRSIGAGGFDVMDDIDWYGF